MALENLIRNRRATDSSVSDQLRERRPGSDNVQAGFLLLALFFMFVVVLD